MRQDATTEMTARRVPARTAPAAALRLLISAAIGALLIALVYQVPARHAVDIGGYDAAYTQGFYDTNRADAPASPGYLEGSDGRARWTHASSFLLFPQIGLPAEVRLRLRAAPNAPAGQQITILLNGVAALGDIVPTTEWQEYRYPINAGVTKLSDVAIELRASTLATLGDGDNREVGVLLDRASLETARWPILPYPSQVAFGALFGALAWMLFRGQGSGRRGDKAMSHQPASSSLQIPTSDVRHPTSNIPNFRRLSFVVGPFKIIDNGQRTNNLVALSLGVMALLFLLVYRLQPLYPYPLRLLLPGLDLVLLAAVALRYVPLVKLRTSLLADSAAVVVGLVWLGAIVLAAHQHIVLSVPGVEKDFHVFAGRSARLFGVFQATGVYDSASDGVLRADGFYNLGYPFLLWLLRPFVFGNPFLAAQIVGAASGAILLLGTWWLARRLLGAGGGLVALVCLACSPSIAEYSLYLGTDMPFAAACVAALALILVAGEGERGRRGDGETSLQPPVPNRLHSISHIPYLILVAAGCAAGVAFLFRHPGVVLLPFGWFVICATAWRSNKKQNVGAPLLVFTFAWLIAALPQLVINLRDTGNPLYSEQAKNIWLAVYGNGDWANWTGAPNTIGLGDVVLSDPARFFGNWFANIRGFLGAGGEDVSEFGRADQLRFLLFPANWLAIAALCFWAIRPHKPAFQLLVIWIVVYAIGVAVGLSNLRFVLPLVPVYAVAAAWSVLWFGQALATLLERRPTLAVRVPLVVGGLLTALIASGLNIGTSYVINLQPIDQVAVVQLVQRTVGPNQSVRIELDPRIQFDEYSAIAHLNALLGQQPTFVLRASGMPSQPNELATGNAGGYTLYRTSP